MPFPCRAHAVPLPCLTAKGLECVFPIWFTQCDRVWFTLAMPCPCHAPTMPFFSKPRHSTSVERRPVGYLPAFCFFRLPRGVARRLLSDACSQRETKHSTPRHAMCESALRATWGSEVRLQTAEWRHSFSRSWTSMTHTYEVLRPVQIYVA